MKKQALMQHLAWLIASADSTQSFEEALHPEAKSKGMKIEQVELVAGSIKVTVSDEEFVVEVK